VAGFEEEDTLLEGVEDEEDIAGALRGVRGFPRGPPEAATARDELDIVVDVEDEDEDEPVWQHLDLPATRN
jgi:hypothetical protein